MIREYLELQNVISRRAVAVGIMARTLKHPYFAAADCISVQPWIAHMDNRDVHIEIGVTRNRQSVTIAVPIDVFETAGTVDFANWIALEADKSNDESAKRATELELLAQLKVKYPEEA